MVKNTKGGSKHKKMARKSNGPVFQEKIRFSTCEDEIYATVAKIYGNGRILVTCNDNVERQCVIRKKFRGKNKKYNEVCVGTYVLVGKREWETKSDKEVTDLLYVYSNEQSIVLKKNQIINTNILSVNERDIDSKEEENYTDFLDEIKEDVSSDIEFNESSSEEETEYNNFEYEEKIDVDDI